MIKIQKFAEGKEFARKDGTGMIAIVTVLDENGKKYKVWRSEWTKTFRDGMELDCKTETKKDRDGFDEVWLVNPNKGKFGGSFAKFNTTIPAYQLAVEILKANGEKMITLSKIKDIALSLKKEFNGGIQTKPVERKEEVPVIQLEEEEEEVKIDDIPF